MAQPGQANNVINVHALLVRAKEVMATNPDLWGDNHQSFSQRDLDLINTPPVDFIAYDDTSFLMKVVHQLRPESLTPTTRWTKTNDQRCKELVVANGAQSQGFFLPVYPYTRRYHDMKVHVRILVPQTRLGAISGTTGFLWSMPDKMKLIRGPYDLTSGTNWDAIIIYDCTASPEGTLQLSFDIAPRKWDVLLIRVSETPKYPWLVAGIRDSGSFADLRHDPSDPRQQRALESLERGGRP
ncbi:hypothetical protein F4774DRAFT_427544 [Daldinia eschscholtzii]|nr:hypothetical protein F4774DRAFT_427544 [Daldinia eschscholtzii]